MAEWQALHDAQHRVDQLQKQCKEALDAWRANPSSEIENKHYKGLNVSLHSAERILEKLTAAASTSGAAAGQRAFSVANPGEDLELVDAETDEVPVRSMKVIRTRQDQLFLDGIKEELASRGQMLVSINDGGFPAYHKGWTCKTFLTTPVRLCVVPKPGVRSKQAVAYPTQQSFLKQIWQAIVG